MAGPGTFSSMGVPGDSERGLVPALIKYWRGRRGLSQLDLAMNAEISARHLSFLETGRARPSREMLLRLGEALDIPLRDRNVMLRTAGYEDEYAEPGLEQGMPPAVARALEIMMQQHEPYPLVVMDRGFDAVKMNRGAAAVIGRLVADPTALVPPVNAFELLFDPRLTRPFVLDWEKAARTMLWRLHLESLSRPGDDTLGDLLARLHAYEGVPESWRSPDLSAPTDPVFTIRLRRDDLELGFLTTLTVFSAPHNITLEELRIESYYPLDEATAAFCRDLAS